MIHQCNDSEPIAIQPKKTMEVQQQDQGKYLHDGTVHIKRKKILRNTNVVTLG